MNLMLIVLVAIGGALGSSCRFVLNYYVHSWFLTAFPLGTMIINVLGSFIMGLLYIILMNKLAGGMEWRAFLLTGILGGFTTFSAFSLDTVLLANQGQAWNALLNVIATVVLCLLGAALGMMIGQKI